MKKNLIATIAICLVLALSSCSKKFNQFNADYFTTNPTPLEVVGNKIPETVTGNIPAKFFVKNAEVTITPVLVYGNEESTSSSITLQGEKVRGNNQVVSYDRGGAVTIPVMFNYKPEMMKSTLFLAF